VHVTPETGCEFQPFVDSVGDTAAINSDDAAAGALGRHPADHGFDVSVDTDGVGTAARSRPSRTTPDGHQAVRESTDRSSRHTNERDIQGLRTGRSFPTRAEASTSTRTTASTGRQPRDYLRSRVIGAGRRRSRLRSTSKNVNHGNAKILNSGAGDLTIDTRAADDHPERRRWPGDLLDRLRNGRTYGTSGCI